MTALDSGDYNSVVRYGSNEYRYARPLAEALRANRQFRSWFLGKTKYATFSDAAVLLDEKQKLARSPSAENWWRSYYAGSAYRFKKECGERETDLLAVFEVEHGFRFALHIEVKAPGDRFGTGQARDYNRRAICWAGNGRNPKTVLPHNEGTTVLCCEAKFREDHVSEAKMFASIVTIEEIAEHLSNFPDAKCTRAKTTTMVGKGAKPAARRSPLAEPGA